MIEAGTEKNELSPISKEIGKTEDLINNLANEIDILQNKLSQIIILNKDDKEKEAKVQPDRSRCDMDRSINENNNLLSQQISRIRELIHSLQI